MVITTRHVASCVADSITAIQHWLYNRYADRLSKLWKSKNISVKTKVHVYKAFKWLLWRMALNAAHLKRKMNDNFIVWR